MLTISEIQIGHSCNAIVTDERPNIRFALASDKQGESLQSAEISCGDWHITTTDQLNNVYGGDMQPFTQYIVHIHAVGTSEDCADAEAAFETGRLDTPWQAKWITDGQYTYPKKESPVPMVFYKEFVISKKVCRAWINSTALGVYEIELNGKKVGRDYFAPGFTSYAHQIQYQTYEITPRLQQQNELRVTVAGGWAAGSFNYNRKSHISCDRQALLLELHLLYADGTEQVVATDQTWQVMENGPYKALNTIHMV